MAGTGEPRNLNRAEHRDTMEAKQIVVPSSECDYKELCRQLREVLGNLHYSTNKCVACGWIASDDDNWEKCTECGNSICQSCWDEARQEAGEEARDDEWPVLCEGCYEEGGSENPTTEACGCVETKDGWLCDGCGHRRCEVCCLYCPCHQDGSPGQDPPCPSCDAIVPANYCDYDYDNRLGAEPCSLCVCASIIGGTTWYCLTHDDLVESADTGGPFWKHETCALDREPGSVRILAEQKYPILAGTRAWNRNLPRARDWSLCTPYSSDSASLALKDTAPRVLSSVAAIEVVLEFAGGEVEAQIVANGDEPKLDDRPVVAMTVRTTVRTTRTSAMGTQ
jgi:hypothetical protein